MSDLSESSSEEQDLSTTSHSNEELKNGHSSRSEEDWPGMDTQNDELFMSMERRLKELVSTTDDLVMNLMMEVIPKEIAYWTVQRWK